MQYKSLAGGIAFLLTATIAQAQQASLTWDDPNAPTLVTGYQLERKSGSGTYAVTSTIPAGAKTAQENLPGGGAYCWRVAALAGSVKSPYSNEVCQTFLAGPVNLLVTITGGIVIVPAP